MSICARDKETLQTLARQVAEIAALPEQQKRIANWKALNALRPNRPLIAIDQLPWHEMDIDGELALQTESDFCRSVETTLRRTLYRWKHLRVDMVVEPVLQFGKTIRGLGFGMQKREKQAITDPDNDVVSHYYLDQLNTEEDIENICCGEVELDAEATAQTEAMARELFDGILEVEMQGALPNFPAWDLIAQWRGVEALLWDLIDRPDFTHRLMSHLTEVYLHQLDQLEEKGLLGHGQRSIHCTGAYTDELPAANFDADKPRAKDLWTYGMAQIFSSVSPAMHREFDIEYAKHWYARFGLGYYGCCEPLHEKIDIVRLLPNLRKISMSPWVDIERGAEQIGADYVFSRKPSPALLAPTSWEPAEVERDLRLTVETCRRYHCPLELILKDISTVSYQPQRLWQWADIAMDIAKG